MAFNLSMENIRKPFIWYMEKNNYHIGDRTGKNNIAYNIIDTIFSIAYFLFSLAKLWSGYNANSQKGTPDIQVLYILTILIILRTMCKNVKRMSNYRSELPEEYKKAASYGMLRSQNGIYVGVLLMSAIYFFFAGFSNITTQTYVMSSAIYLIAFLVELTDIIVDLFKCVPAINKIELG